MKLKSIWMAVSLAFLPGICSLVQAQGFFTVHYFGAQPEGYHPGQLVLANGIFYGNTSDGGTNGSGSLFTYNTNGAVFTPLFSFSGETNNGVSPNTVLVNGGTIYGTALGGMNNVGMIFAIGTNGLGFRSIFNFGALDGSLPEGLILSGATLFGTAQVGGTNAVGTIYKINTNGTGFTVLHTFTNTPDGAQPQGELLLNGATLYGTTSSGGANQGGTVFSINTNGSEYTILRNFTNNSTDAYSPMGGALVLNSGTLYGVTSRGGINTNGTIFAIGTNGTGYKILHSFGPIQGNLDGKLPKSQLSFNNGYLFGTTTSGGISNGGTIFLINTNGTGFATIESFINNGPTGSDPLSGVIRSGDSVWGTAFGGGDVPGHGVIFRLQLPAFTSQPQDLTVTNTSPASFSASAADDGVFHYQWYFNTTTLLANQTNSTLTLASATNNNAGTYTVVITDSLGSVTSSPAVLTVIVPGTPPTITSQPHDFTVLQNGTATFTNAASGALPLYYQWYFNTNTPVFGGVNANILTVSPATTTGYYTVVVTNQYGSATSAPAKLTVIVPSAPAITQQPHDYTVTNGFNAFFTNGASGTGPLFFGWYRNTNTFVFGGINASNLTISPATTNQAGFYTVIVTNLYGSATSTPAKLTVVVPPSTPTIVQQPQDYTVTNGYPAAFTNVVTGAGPFSYQWYFNTNTAVTGGTNAILLIPFALTNDAGYYRVIVGNVGGSATSGPAKLTVISTKPIIFDQPDSLTVTSGAPISLTVLAAGLNPLKYQWYSNTVSTLRKVANQTNSTLFIAVGKTNYSNTYFVVVSNSLGSVTSSPVLLTVVGKPIMILQPVNVVVTNGDDATFTSEAFGPGPLKYQWYFRTNTAVAGATNTFLTFTNAITNIAGIYSVRVTNTFGSVTSSYVRLSISNGLNFLAYTFNPGDLSPSFALANIAKSTNRIWASTNLTFWQVIGSNVMATNGLWFFTDTNATKTNNARFYRFSSP